MSGDVDSEIHYLWKWEGSQECNKQSNGDDEIKHLVLETNPLPVECYKL